jgi:hypothetical protein
MNEFETAKAITRHFYPTPAWTRDLNDGRPTCQFCQCPCAIDREYKAMRACQSCYDEQPLTIYRRGLPACLAKSKS